MESQQLKNILEAALLAAGEPRAIDQLRALFGDDNPPDKQEIRAALQMLQDDYTNRGIELREVASGFRVQVRESMSHWLARLWEERPPRYSRALMETLAIIAYRQPVTRGDVEEIRGVVVTSNIIRTLLERNWIKVVGHRDVPGKPAMFGTTREFLDYFGLQKLDNLPPLAELARLEPVSTQLDLGTADQENGGYIQALDTGISIADTQPVFANQDMDLNFAEALESGPQVAESMLVVATADDDEDDDLDDDDDDDDDDFDEDEDEDEDEDDYDDDDDDDDDEDLDDDAELDSAEELAPATEGRHLLQAESTGPGDADESASLRHGAVTPLVGLRPRGVATPQPGTVSSLDEARAAAGVRRAEESADDDLDTDNSHPADVLPLKSS